MPAAIPGGVRILTVEEIASWRAAVRAAGGDDVCFEPEYARLWTPEVGGVPELFVYEADGGALVLPWRRRPLATLPGLQGLAGWHDITSDYGYGGPLARLPDEGGARFLARALDALDAALRELGVVSSFVRFHPLLANQRLVEGRWPTVRLNETAVVDLEQPVEAFLPGLRTDHRQGVRKAIAAGVRVREGNGAADLDAFHRLYLASMDNAGAADFYRLGRAFFARHLALLGERATILVAELEGRPAAAAMFLFGGRFAHYHFAGIDRAFARLVPNKLLVYEAMLLARARGCSRLHLGGGRGGRDDSLMMFKRGFTRLRAECHLAKRILDERVYRDACRRRGIENADALPFPAYRSPPTRALAS